MPCPLCGRNHRGACLPKRDREETDGEDVRPSKSRKSNDAKGFEETPSDREDPVEGLDGGDAGAAEQYKDTEDPPDLTLELGLPLRDAPSLERRHAINTHQPPRVRIGVATWNINHYTDQRHDDTVLQRRYESLLAKRRAMLRDSPVALQQRIADDDATYPEPKPQLLTELRSKRRKELRLTILEVTLQNTRTELASGQKSALRKVREKLLEAKDDDAWAAIAERLSALGTSTKRQAITKAASLAKKMAKPNAAANYLEVVRVRLHRIDLWVQHVERLAQMVEVPLTEPDAEVADETAPPKSYGAAFSGFDDAFADAKEHYSLLKGELKRRAVIWSLAALFERNPWLDAVLLQEVNSFQGLRARFLDPAMQRRLPILRELSLKRGPHMTGGKGVTAARTTEKKQGVQHESYPIVYRARRLRWREWFVVDLDGQERRDDPFPWDKNAATRSYRPIVVHVVEERNNPPPQRVHLGIVHTTPGSLKGDSSDRELDRRNEHKQLKAAFATIAGRVAGGEWWIIGGDYYLSPESIAEDPASLECETIIARLEERGYDIDALISAGTPKPAKPRPTKPKAGAPAKQVRKPRAKIDWTERSQEVLHLALQKAEMKELKARGITLNKLLLAPSQREVVRHLIGVTFADVLQPCFRIGCAASGSNWHDVRRLWDPPPTTGCEHHFSVARVADLFVYSHEGAGPHFREAEVGLLHADGQMVVADGEDSLPVSTFWSLISDHFPVAGYFSSQSPDGALEDAVRFDREEGMRAATWLARYRLVYKLHRIVTEVLGWDVDVGEWARQVFTLDEIYDDGGLLFWLESLPPLITMRQRTGGLVDVRLQRYRQERLADPARAGVRVWDDKQWYGYWPFWEGDANGWWELLEEAMRTVEERHLKAKDRSTLSPVTPGDYADEGRPVDDTIRDMRNLGQPAGQDPGQGPAPQQTDDIEMKLDV